MITKRFPRGLYAPEQLESRIAPATFIVTSLADDGSDGTLRKEVLDANAAPGADTIVFKLTDRWCRIPSSSVAPRSPSPARSRSRALASTSSR